MMWLDGLLGFFAALGRSFGGSFMGSSGLNPDGGQFMTGSGLNPDG